MLPGSNTLKGKLFKLIGPIFLETLLTLTLGVVDTLMLSHHSDDAVAAVGVVNQLLNMVFLLFNITTTGTAVMCALYFGARNEKSFVQVVGTSLLFNSALGIVISALLLFVISALLLLGGERMLVWMDLRPDLMPDAVAYMRIVGGFGFFQAVNFTISAVLRAANKPNYAMQVVLMINILNIFGNYSLIFGHFGFPALGVQGAAISTSVCRGIAMLLLFLILFKPFPFDKLRSVLKVGMPSAIEQISYDSSQVMVVYFINMLGNEVLAARVYVMNIVIIGYIFSLAMAQATSICTGNLVGGQKKRAAYLLSWYGWRWSLLVTFIASVSVYLLGRPLFVGASFIGDLYGEPGDHHDRHGCPAGRCLARARAGDGPVVPFLPAFGGRCRGACHHRDFLHVDLCGLMRLPVRHRVGIGSGWYVVCLRLGRMLEGNRALLALADPEVETAGADRAERGLRRALVERMDAEHSAHLVCC